MLSVEVFQSAIPMSDKQATSDFAGEMNGSWPHVCGIQAPAANVQQNE